MNALTPVQIPALPAARFAEVLAPETWAHFDRRSREARSMLAGRTVWNINSTARGGGVAEMLASLLAYARGVGVDARWSVIGGTPLFFALTKRIHNRLHGDPGDGGPLGAEEHRIYQETLAPAADELASLVDELDVVLLHDPQTAGLVPGLVARGVPVVWRCHVGVDEANEHVREVWDFLRPYVREARAVVFSRDTYVWDGLDRERLIIAAPSIDAFSAKNQDLDAGAVEGILAASGLQEDGEAREGLFAREDGSPARVTRRAEVMGDRPLRPDEPMVLQVSRWDALKDPLGVIDGFIVHVMPHTNAHLVYAGPSVEAVSDDPEGAAVLQAARARWEGLDPAAQARVHLTTLPMDDIEENAAIVNALQRRADVVVQKSLAEGFGLTVAEAMWKRRPVVASRVGGIQDQIEHDHSGVLLDDPADLAAYGAAVRGLLADPQRAAAMGEAARDRVRDRFLGTRSLLQYVDLFEVLMAHA